MITGMLEVYSLREQRALKCPPPSLLSPRTPDYWRTVRTTERFLEATILGEKGQSEHFPGRPISCPNGMEWLTESSPKDLSRGLRAVGRCWGRPTHHCPRAWNRRLWGARQHTSQGSPTPKPHTQTSGDSGPSCSSPRAAPGSSSSYVYGEKLVKSTPSTERSCFPLLKAESPTSKGKPSPCLTAVIKSHLSLSFPSQTMPITNTKGKDCDSWMFPILTADCHKFPSPWSSLRLLLTVLRSHHPEGRPLFLRLSRRLLEGLAKAHRSICKAIPSPFAHLPAGLGVSRHLGFWCL